MLIKKDQSAIYRTYFNYSVSLSRLFQQEYPTIKDLVDKVTSLSGFNKIAEGTTSDLGELEKSLHLAWHTEMLLSKELNHQDLLHYALPWSMVQSYYCIYQIIRAYFNACGRKIGNTHNATLNTINSDLIECKERFPSPWRCIIEGDTLLNQSVITNVDNPISITLKNSLYSPHTTDPWQYFGLMLKTTHSRKIKAKIDDWKRKKNRKKISKEDRQFLISKIKPTTIFNYFYRLRIRSNYQDIELFLLPFIDQYNLVEMQKAIIQTVSYTMCLFECMIIKSTGVPIFKDILINSLPPTLTLGVSVENMALKRWSDLKHYF